MPDTVRTLIAVLAVFCLLYAALTGWRFGLRVRSERAARRKGLLLNLARRALPPVVAGVLILGAGSVLALPGIGALAALIIGGGLAFGLHRGLAEMQQDTRILILLRLGASLGLTLGWLWLNGGA
ncbi:MAG: hypothetical protein NXH79_01675 [Rhodobacteraceae bacterium]|nr:hypothetical protein [Paracoccaceae bacterium]